MFFLSVVIRNGDAVDGGRNDLVWFCGLGPKYLLVGHQQVGGG